MHPASLRHAMLEKRKWKSKMQKLLKIGSSLAMNAPSLRCSVVKNAPTRHQGRSSSPSPSPRPGPNISSMPSN
jgi:hypothetical protein